LKYAFCLVALVCLAMPAGGCRIAQKGNVDTFDEADATNSSSGAPASVGSRAMPGGDPRVSLVNAPCGNSPDTEVFLARARTKKLLNQLGKLPASNWKLSAGGRIMSICALMASRDLNLAWFFVYRSGCEACEATVRQSAEALANIQRTGGATSRLPSRIVAIEAGRPEERTADPGLPLIYAADPTGQLLATLTSPSDPGVMPVFVAHRSGYGFFSNTPGAARDGIGSDFEALVSDR
jgi:hypothetical protein